MAKKKAPDLGDVLGRILDRMDKHDKRLEKLDERLEQLTSDDPEPEPARPRQPRNKDEAEEAEIERQLAAAGPPPRRRSKGIGKRLPMEQLAPVLDGKGKNPDGTGHWERCQCKDCVGVSRRS